MINLLNRLKILKINKTASCKENNHRDKFLVLKEKFGYLSFRPGQEEVIDSILGGRDVFAMMPTGAGKSLCFQIPALILDGMTIVISPLISLMKDQVVALREAGCEAAFLNSSLSGEEYTNTIKKIHAGKIKLLYIAPERLQKDEITKIATNINLSLVVVDEAHCVSQWGHDFRTSYLRISAFITGIKKRPVVAAFTATATKKVKEDICRFLELEDPYLINTGIDRPNLYFEVIKPKNKIKTLLNCLGKKKKSSGIIYCATRKKAEEIYTLLVSNGFAASRYHAGLSDDERSRNQEDFIYDRKTIMVATNAFGMGINKSNVSFVIHYNMPKNMESYYQEAGRAGRDGSPADCILLYSNQDVRINHYLITHGEETEKIDEKLLAYKLDLLKKMTSYACSCDCLRRSLLIYFGEDHASDICGNCSNCNNEQESVDVTIEAQKIVSCVYRLKERGRAFGRSMIIDVLRGSKGKRILENNFNTLSTWGILRKTSAFRIRYIMDHLIDEGFIIRKEGEYSIVKLGNTAKLFNDERRVLMKIPEEQEPVYKIKNKETDNILFNKLRDLRKDIAVKEGVPAYIIFHDTSLREMSQKIPVSLDQFSAMHGVGNKKLIKYGKIFTDFIKENA